MNPTEPGKSALLYLEDHTVFHGRSVGLSGTSGGEICFNTGMTGYQEIFTDPSYFGQIMVTASTHIGNYGTKGSEDESAQLQIAGLIGTQPTSSSTFLNVKLLWCVQPPFSCTCATTSAFSNQSRVVGSSLLRLLPLELIFGV